MKIHLLFCMNRSPGEIEGVPKYHDRNNNSNTGDNNSKTYLNYNNNNSNDDDLNNISSGKASRQR